MKELNHFALEYVRKLTDAALVELRARYALSQAIRGLNSDSGPCRDVHAIEKLASLLNVDASALRRLGRVSATLSPDDFERVLGVRLAGGHALTWSHIEMLTLVPGRARRLDLLLGMEGRASSIRELASTVRQLRREGASAPPRPVGQDCAAE